MRRLKQHVPWFAKIPAKILLARTAVPHSFWHRIGLFQHGFMDEPDYAIGVFDGHLELLGRPVPGYALLELGPGDSVGTAVVAKARGAQRSVLIDAGRFATPDVSYYRALARRLRERGYSAPDLDGAQSVEDVLRLCHSTYLTDGLTSLRSLPDAAFDHVISQAVVEHIRLRDVEATFREVRRLLKPSGSSSHTIDLRDHLGEALNNLRFSEGRWESPLFADSGFYTNRLRHSQLVAIFERCGFAVTSLNVNRWAALPTPRKRLQPRFRRLSDEELRVSTFDCVLRPV